MRGVDQLLTRRRARRWQRWSEVEPERDYARWAGIGTAIAGALMLGVFVMIVVGLVVLR